MDRPPLRTYGRIKTRTLKPRQAVLIDVLLPRLGVPDGPFERAQCHGKLLFGSVPAPALPS